VSPGNQSCRIALQSFGASSGREGATAKVTGGRSLNESEENIVTKNGIIRTMDVRIETMPDGRSEGSLKDLE